MCFRKCIQSLLHNSLVEPNNDSGIFIFPFLASVYFTKLNMLNSVACSENRDIVMPVKQHWAEVPTLNDNWVTPNVEVTFLWIPTWVWTRAARLWIQCSTKWAKWINLISTLLSFYFLYSGFCSFCSHLTLTYWQLLPHPYIYISLSHISTVTMLPIPDNQYSSSPIIHPHRYQQSYTHSRTAHTHWTPIHSLIWSYRIYIQ